MRLVVALLLAVACTPMPPQPPLPPQPTPDPWDGGDDRSRGTCATACARALQLGCASAKPTAHGASCVEVCSNIMGSGVIRWNLPCRSAAASCVAADRCER